MRYKHFVTIGHLDHGKSSMLGRLLWDMGKISDDTKSRLVEIGGEEGRQFAYVLDQKKEEQGRGITIDVGHNKLLVDGYSFTFSDAPGHEVFLDKAYKGIEESDGAILVIAADEGIKEQTLKHIEHAKKFNITDFVICINKIDIVDYDEKVFKKISNEISKYLPEISQTNIIPTSALKGENITKPSKKMTWYTGNTFLDCLKNVNTKENTIDELIQQSKEIIQKGVETFKNPVMLWAGGKDSTTSISIARECFDGKLPFPVLFIDTSYKFSETYEFMDMLAKQWSLDFIKVKNQDAISRGINPKTTTHLNCCNELKTNTLKKAIIDNNFDGVFVAIRWDEHGIRGKEQYFSQRNDPPHMRVHPMLHWSEKEIWDYINSRGVPYNPLYDKEEHEGMVYRSIGCWPCTKPLAKDHPEERAGRQLDKERIMEDLRSLGYM